MVGVRGVFHLGAASKVLPSLKPLGKFVQDFWHLYLKCSNVLPQPRNPHMGTFNVERNSVGTSRVLEAKSSPSLLSAWLGPVAVLKCCYWI